MFKKLLWCVMAIIVSITALSSVAPAATQQQVSQWRSMSQSARNQAILSRAYSQNGQYTGLSCKEWVRSVVFNASQTVVWLPSTSPNNYQWYYQSDIYAVPACPAPLSSIGPGAIIQMRWNNTLHTAIVTGRDSNGMQWIDCNWGQPTENRTVRIHYVTNQQFMSATQGFYSVYYVL